MTLKKYRLGFKESEYHGNCFDYIHRSLVDLRKGTMLGGRYIQSKEYELQPMIVLKEFADDIINQCRQHNDWEETDTNIFINRKLKTGFKLVIK